VHAPGKASIFFGQEWHVVRCGRVSGLVSGLVMRSVMRRGPLWRYANQVRIEKADLFAGWDYAPQKNREEPKPLPADDDPDGPSYHAVTQLRS